MKSIIYIILATTIFGCQKESTTSNQIDLIGKWKLVESYDNYKNPSQFEWNTIPDSTKIEMEYALHNAYTLKHNNITLYSGKYKLVESNTKVIITDPNGNTDYIFGIEDYSKNNITVQYNSTSGLFKQKFVRQ